MDNFYMSPILFKEVANLGFGAVGHLTHPGKVCQMC